MLMIEDGVNKVTDEELAEAVAYYSSDQVQQYIKVNFEETELNQYTTRDGITIFLPTQYAIQSKLDRGNISRHTYDQLLQHANILANDIKENKSRLSSNELQELNKPYDGI